MENMESLLEALANKAAKLSDVPQIPYLMPEIPTIKIDPKDTFAYQMQEQINKIIENNNEQIRLLKQNTEQLANNYKKLEGLLALKEQELSDAKQEAEAAKKEAKKAKRYNTIMMIISIVSMLVAIAAWLLPEINVL